MKIDFQYAEALIAALPEPAMLVAGDMIVTIANDAMVTLLEANPQGQHITSYYRAPAIVQAIQAAMNGGAKAHVAYLTSSPSPRSFDVFVAPLNLADQAVHDVLLIVRDLTYEQQIERMRADFVANASHELRTPLATLAGFIETMQGAAKQDATAREKFLGLMKTQADRMTRLADDLLSLSRIEINEHVRPSSKVDVALLIGQCVGLLASTAKAAGCKIDLICDREIKVIGDADQLQQVFQNLIENAIKYGGSNKPINVSVVQGNQTTDVTVRDHGAGIAAHHIPRLTERFYRVDVQASRTRGGTGLGLAIVKHILNRHRGKLIVESELGQGSSFIVRLPNS